MVEDKILQNRDHQLTLKRREDLLLDGVLNVESFDEGEIVVETVAGGLIVKGDDLHITQLNLDGGSMVVHGFIDSLQYTGEMPGRKGRTMLSRLFK
ncbi:MAG: sporulation protein YabP [Bacillota bacterium]|nr:sporulation protein YabP [Bacillota bacterium]